MAYLLESFPRALKLQTLVTISRAGKRYLHHERPKSELEVRERNGAERECCYLIWQREDGLTERGEREREREGEIDIRMFIAQTIYCHNLLLLLVSFTRFKKEKKIF